MITLLAKGLLAGLFLLAATVKFQDLQGFAASIRSFHLIPVFIVPFIAATVPVMEVVFALGQFFRKIGGGAQIGLIWLSGCFVCFYSYSLFTGISPECGCFGKIAILNVSPMFGFFRASAMFFLSVFLWYLDVRCRATGRLP